MSISDVIQIIDRAAILLDAEHEDGIGFCQGGYSANGIISQGLATTLDAGLTGLDILGAMHRAAYEEDLLAFEADARDAMATYLGYAKREDTSGTIIREWNDETGRTGAEAVSLLEQLSAYLAS